MAALWLMLCDPSSGLPSGGVGAASRDLCSGWTEANPYSPLIPTMQSKAVLGVLLCFCLDHQIVCLGIRPWLLALCLAGPEQGYV